MLVVGVTGGIGAGKSTVSRMFAQWGALVIDADQIAREVVEKDPRILQHLAEAFGSGILHADGSLNRRELGRLAFRDRRGGESLNGILHPPILARLKSLLAQLRQSDYRGIVVVDAALLVECRVLGLVDKLVVVEAPEHLRRQRLMEHAGLSAGEIRDRMAAQLPSPDKSKLADHIIVNDVPFSLLRERAAQIWKSLKEEGTCGEN
jgi:dephospho-CoA kinase